MILELSIKELRDENHNQKKFAVRPDIHERVLLSVGVFWQFDPGDTL